MAMKRLMLRRQVIEGLSAIAIAPVFGCSNADKDKGDAMNGAGSGGSPVIDQGVLGSGGSPSGSGGSSTGAGMAQNGSGGSNVQMGSGGMTGAAGNTSG